LSLLIRTLRNLGKGLVRGLPAPEEGRDPFDLFSEWFDIASESNIILPEAMTLATATKDGQPSARMVLLKGHGPKGFVFFTNYGSRKSHELDSNPRAALVIHWEVLQRQVRIEGSVERLSADESSDYFATRPRGSQLGAWASRQSDVLSDRNVLHDAVAEVESRFSGVEIPRPEFWGGYRVIPDRIEFWQGQTNRLHDRLVFTRRGDGWNVERLYP
jgi:pyridoxamine 5'-phosphate oxidase